MLRKARRPRSLQTLRDRIRRGTLRGIQKGRFWYVYPEDVERLARQPYRSRGGRPHSITPSSTAYAEGRLALDTDEILRLGNLPLGTRIAAMLGAQAILFGIKRAQIEHRHPKASAREIVLKVFEELKDGEHQFDSHILRPSHPHAR